MPDRAQPTSIRLPVDLKRALDREADIERRTVSWLIVETMSKWVEWRRQNRDAALGASTEVRRAKK
jgi:predicted transcriptional regulator